MEDPFKVYSVEDYKSAFRILEDTITETELKMLSSHYHAPARTVTATQLAVAIGNYSYESANAGYGRLGRKISNYFEVNPEMPTEALVLFSKPDHEWFWKMRYQVAQALEELRWVTEATLAIPEEIIEDDQQRSYEGSVVQVKVNRYERNPWARRKCIEHYGAKCIICEFDFGLKYGEMGKGVIHVHHLHPLSEIGPEHEIDPMKDLRPVCPNCHTMIHQRNPPHDIDEVKRMLGVIHEM